MVAFARLLTHASLLSTAPEWRFMFTREGHDPDVPEVDAFAALAAVPFADRIRGMNFACGWCDLDELDAILTPAVVRNLRELRFPDDDHKMETLGLLLTRPELRLEVLGFFGDSCEGLGDDGCAAIASTDAYSSLRWLELPNNEIGPDGVAALAASPHLRGLRNLDLAGGSNAPNVIGPEGAASIAASENFRHLESLNLVFNGILDAGFIALAESRRLPALQSLNVPGNGVTDAGIRALVRSAGLPALNWLNVCGTRHGPGITADGVRELVNSPRMRKLTGLKLASHRIGDEGAAALADATAAGNLRLLLVTGCGIGYDGFVRMLESPHLAGVREFHLFENELTEDEERSLKERYGDRVK